MRLTMRERKRVTAMIAPRYQRAQKRHKGIMLNEFIALTGYSRCYASYVLRAHGKRVKVSEETIIEGDVRKRAKRKRKKTYDSNVKKALIKIWAIMDCICGKRLASALKEVTQILQRYKEIKLDRVTRKKLYKISAATIDRLLADERKKQRLKGRSHTKPGTVLKNQIPIRTFSEWDDRRPGFVEIDLVGHDGGDARGEFVQTLDVTDVYTGWTETEAVKNKAQIWVFQALKDIRNRLPFDVRGIDSDNGSEFINHHLLRFCSDEKITFTRTRSYRKNDNCFVEQKNYSVVRRSVGYYRYDTGEELRILNEVYGHLRLYTNFFQPVMKLMQKTRVGSKVTKKYDKPRTPYKRVLESPDVQEERKEHLRKQYATLNPADLKRKITKLQQKLLKIVSLKEKLRKQHGDSNQGKVSYLGGYPDMGSYEKNDCRAFGKTDSSGFFPNFLIVVKKDRKRCKRVK
jgi:hypothetical protein